jgi:hypothetical protein
MINDKDTTPDDLAVDDLDTVAGGVGHGEQAALTGPAVSAMAHCQIHTPNENPL